MSDPNTITITIPVPKLATNVRVVRASLYLLLAGLSVMFIGVASCPPDWSYRTSEMDMYRYGVALGIMTLLVCFYNGFLVHYILPTHPLSHIRTELGLFFFVHVQWMIISIIVTIDHSVSSFYGAVVWIGWVFSLALFCLLLGAAGLAHRRGRKDVWRTSVAEVYKGEGQIQLPVGEEEEAVVEGGERGIGKGGV